jgi:hypothetical protein
MDLQWDLMMKQWGCLTIFNERPSEHVNFENIILVYIITE